mmetsp:Transcript_14339/g.36646  ORF Transcript_14339/g.36646 Transcript_14339/m.36646 type:complete len:435 (-) Transcript_14339:1315-2619(-)
MPLKKLVSVRRSQALHGGLQRAVGEQRVLRQEDVGQGGVAELGHHQAQTLGCGPALLKSKVGEQHGDGDNKEGRPPLRRRVAHKVGLWEGGEVEQHLQRLLPRGLPEEHAAQQQRLHAREGCGPEVAGKGGLQQAQQLVVQVPVVLQQRQLLFHNVEGCNIVLHFIRVQQGDGSPQQQWMAGQHAHVAAARHVEDSGEELHHHAREADAALACRLQRERVQQALEHARDSKLAGLGGERAVQLAAAAHVRQGGRGTHPVGHHVAPIGAYVRSVGGDQHQHHLHKFLQQALAVQAFAGFIGEFTAPHLLTILPLQQADELPPAAQVLGLAPLCTQVHEHHVGNQVLCRDVHSGVGVVHGHHCRCDERVDVGEGQRARLHAHFREEHNREAAAVDGHVGRHGHDRDIQVPRRVDVGRHAVGHRLGLRQQRQGCPAV